MLCPVCNVELRLADRQGVEIDYCPQCRGVWLDRGELEKLIERSISMPYANEGYERRSQHSQEYRGERYGDKHGGDHDQGERRRGSFLRNLFDL